MSKIKLTVPGIITDGKQISFKAPCNSEDAEGLVISNVTYDIVDAIGNSICGRRNMWINGSMVSVILNTTTRKAYIQNPSSTPVDGWVDLPINTVEFSGSDFIFDADLTGILCRNMMLNIKYTVKLATDITIEGETLPAGTVLVDNSFAGEIIVIADVSNYSGKTTCITPVYTMLQGLVDVYGLGYSHNLEIEITHVKYSGVYIDKDTQDGRTAYFEDDNTGCQVDYSINNGHDIITCNSYFESVAITTQIGSSGLYKKTLQMDIPEYIIRATPRHVGITCNSDSNIIGVSNINIVEPDDSDMVSILFTVISAGSFTGDIPVSCLILV